MREQPSLLEHHERAPEESGALRLQNMDARQSVFVDNSQLRGCDRLPVIARVRP